jgi:hypothetical protein
LILVVGPDGELIRRRSLAASSGPMLASLGDAALAMEPSSGEEE